MNVQQFHVLGMTCEHCERAVTAELSKIPSVTKVGIELHPGDTSIVALTSEQPIEPHLIAAAVVEAGYQLSDA